MSLKYKHFFPLVIFLSSCSRMVSGKDIVGSYMLVGSSNVDTLVLFDDHNFYHSEYSAIGKIFKEEGQWDSTTDGYFELRNYCSYLGKNFSSQDINPTTNIWGNIIISLGSNMHYKKI